MNAQEIIAEFKKNVERFISGEVMAKGAIIGILNKACGGDANRYLLLKVLTGKTSSKDLTEAEWYALLLMVNPEKPIGGHWHSGIGDYELSMLCGALLAFHASETGKFPCSRVPTRIHGMVHDKSHYIRVD